MTNEQLRMQMLSGIITESQYKSMLNENKDIDDLRSHMENAIDRINNNENLSDKGKKQRIDNVRFVVYNSLDPNTNGGERPSSDFQFDDAWWNSTYEGANDFVTALVRGEIEGAVKGNSFGEDPMNESKSLNESMIGGIVGVGAVTQIPSREKTDYEMAFEHFLGERYLTNFENREQDPYKMEEGKEKIDEMDEDDELEDLIDWAQTKLWGDFDYDEYEVKKMSPQKLYYELENLIYSYDPDYTKFKKFESMVNEEVKKEVKENATPNLYMDLKNTLFPYYTDLTGEERVTMIDKIIKELNAYVSILQNEKNTK